MYQFDFPQNGGSNCTHYSHANDAPACFWSYRDNNFETIPILGQIYLDFMEKLEFLKKITPIHIEKWTFRLI